MSKYIHYFCSRKINCCCHLIGTSSVATGFLTVILPFSAWCIFSYDTFLEIFSSGHMYWSSAKNEKNTFPGLHLVLTHFGQSEPFPSHAICSVVPLHLKDLLSLLGMVNQRALRTHEQPVKAEWNWEMRYSGFSPLLSHFPKSFLTHLMTWEVCCYPNSPTQNSVMPVEVLPPKRLWMDLGSWGRGISSIFSLCSHIFNAACSASGIQELWVSTLLPHKMLRFSSFESRKQ